MTALQTTTPAPLPSASVPVPSVTNQQLLRSLPGAGLFPDRVKRGEFTADQLPALRVLEAELVRANEPAKEWDAAAELEKLFSHYPRPDLPDAVAATRLNDWYDDLEGIPLPVIQAAARDWRRSTAKFAPTPGQFLEKAQRYHAPHRVALGMTRKLIEALTEAQGAAA